MSDRRDVVVSKSNAVLFWCISYAAEVGHTWAKHGDLDTTVYIFFLLTFSGKVHTYIVYIKLLSITRINKVL